MAKNSVTVPASAFDFLKALKKHNDRNWFNANKERFLTEQSAIEAFADALLMEMNSHDMIETQSGKKSLHRIYRDTRFSKDKTPYKNNFSGSFSRAGKQRRGGYYFHLQPGNSFVAGGFWGPDTNDLKRIRDEIAIDATPLRKIIGNKYFISTFGSIQGEQLKTVPRGFDATNDAIDLLRYKQFLLIHKFKDEELLSGSFLKNANQAFRHMRPFLDYMSEVLITDMNGRSIL
ncbi:MAG: DUF2461 domain-containing protein [Ferruginibacter sp.]